MLILTIHGLGGSSFSHKPMKLYLEKYLTSSEKINVISHSYDSTNLTFPQVLEELESFLSNYQWINDDEKAIVIGHSLGGIVATHLNHQRIKGVITVSSPHTKCDFAKFFKDTAPTFISNYFLGKMYDTLVNQPLTSTIPKITCITSSWYPWYKFDGRVYTEEMIHPQATKTYHLEYSDHLIQLYDPRMLNLIYEAVIDLM